MLKRKKKDEFDEHDDEVVYVTMKDESYKDEATALVTCVNKNDRWIIDSGCSHHMTRDKSKLGISTKLGHNSTEAKSTELDLSKMVTQFS